jgi:hypothetical protein
VGGFKDASNNHPDRMDPMEIVKSIAYILDSNVNIPIIGIEKIIDSEMQTQLNKKVQHV